MTADIATTGHQSPRKLLEARYDAFVRGNVDFILETHHPDTRNQVDRQAIESWAKNSKWLGIHFEEEEVKGDKATISFCVRYEKNYETINHRELAEFRMHEGRWYYYDSEFPKATPEKREETKVGRNDLCVCGSGKKYKKCCGVRP